MAMVVVNRFAIVLAAAAFMSDAVATEAIPAGQMEDVNNNRSEWRLIGGNAEAQHYSPIGQINDKNVKRLGIAWFADMPTRDGMVGVPLVADGIVYQSGAHSIIYANDARTGKALWTFDPQVKLHGSMLSAVGALSNRGVALWRDLVIVGTGDCRLVAVDRLRGIKRWETQACDFDGQRLISGAPRVGGNKVFIGNANGDTGTRRGHVDAFDAATGRRLWRFYTIPGDPAKGFETPALAAAAKTWGKDWWKTVNGGSVWDSMTYDPVLNLLYIGVGGPSPFDPRQRGAGRGDELFTNSIVALNADTGEYVWHYQTTPDDAWNLEPTMPIMIADLKIAGSSRRVVMEAPKNGFFYVLDAKSGHLLSARNYAPVNWASSIDMKTGRPIELSSARYYDQPDGRAVVWPGPYGAHSWQPMSYSAQTGLVYIPVMEMKASMRAAPGRESLGGDLQVDVFYDLEHDAGRLVAWDPLQQKSRWSVKLPSIWNGGVLASAGNVVFQGTATGEFRAYQAATGDMLWSMQLDSGISSAPSTAELDGVQYVYLAVGSGTSAISQRSLTALESTKLDGVARLIAFKIDGNIVLPGPATVQAPFTRPPVPRAEPELVKRGELLFDSVGCEVCHGAHAVAAPRGSVPDLRRASATTHASFAAIVLGARAAQGMPSFSGVLEMSDIDALHAYIIERAWEAYESHNSTATHPPL